MWTVEVTAAFRYSCTRRPVQVTLLRSWIGTYTQRSEPSILLDGSWGPRNVIAVRSNYSIVHTRGHTHPSLISMATKECFEGISWDGSPTGKETTIAGLDAYVNQPASGPVESALLLVSDIFGWKANNARLYVDKLASEGYYVVLPDVLHGKALDMGSFDRSKFAEWLKQFPRDKVFADCIKVIDELKASHGVKNVGVEGFCWGGLYAVLLAGTQAVNAAVVAHPSFVTMEDVAAIVQPTLFLAPANDSAFPDDMREQVDEVMREKGLGEVIYYPHAAHGWTMRGDLSKPEIKDAVNDAYKRAVLFFAVNVGRA